MNDEQEIPNLYEEEEAAASLDNVNLTEDINFTITSSENGSTEGNKTTEPVEVDSVQEAIVSNGDNMYVTENHTRKEGEEMLVAERKPRARKADANAMVVDESKAREMLFAVGLKTAASCPNKKIVEQLNSLLDWVDELDIPDNEADKALLQNCLDALRNHRSIQLMADRGENSNGHSDTIIQPKRGRGRPRKIPQQQTAAVNQPRVNRITSGRKLVLEAGTTFSRDYKGTTYKARVLADGSISCGGEHYSSLTKAALAITGYKNISGPEFFCVHKRAD